MDLDCPDSRRRGAPALALEQRARETIGREFLPGLGPLRDGDAAIAAQPVLASVLVTMIMAEGERGRNAEGMAKLGLAADHPGPRVILADTKRDADLVLAAVAHLHHQPASGEIAIGLDRRADDPPFEGLPAKRRKSGEECVARRLRRDGRNRAECACS